MWFLIRVLAKISKIPVQNINYKKLARPDLATYLLQILIPATFNSLVCQKGQFTLQQFSYVLEHVLSGKYLVIGRKVFGYYPPYVKIKYSS